MLFPVLKARHERGEILKVSVVGAGQMGEGLVAQMETMLGMRAYVVADVVPGRAAEVLRSAGVREHDIVSTDDREVATQAVDSGRRVATTNSEIAWVEPIDVTVEATGIPDIGAKVAHGAILARKHVVQMNVETDATVGWFLRRRANEADVVYTLTAGDEPGATMELYDFAVSLGFTIVCAGKGKNNPLDRSANPVTMADRAEKQQMNPKMLASFVDGSKTMVEMTSLANALGFIPDVPGMHGPQVTSKELAQVYVPRSHGGILGGVGRVEYGRGIAPGVFVIFTTEHPKLVRDLQYLSMGPGPFWALYRPYHLTSLETPISIARAAIYSDTTIATDLPPTAETVAVAKRPLQTGETLDGIGGHSTYGLIYAAAEAKKGRMLPLGLAPGAVVRRSMEIGQPLTYDDVTLDESLTIVELRKLQDVELQGA